MTPRAREAIERKAAEHGVTVADLMGPRRHQKITHARFDAMAEVYALHKEPGRRAHSMPQVGAIFGGRDHTTVLSALRRAEQLFGYRDPIYPRLRFYDGEETRL